MHAIILGVSYELTKQIARRVCNGTEISENGTPKVDSVREWDKPQDYKI